MKILINVRTLFDPELSYGSYIIPTLDKVVFTIIINIKIHHIDSSS